MNEALNALLTGLVVGFGIGVVVCHIIVLLFEPVIT